MMTPMELLGTNSLIWYILFALWTLPWKAYALWTAAKRGDKRWFVLLLILNTLAILEIYYIFKVVKKTRAEVWQFFTQKVIQF